MRRNDWLLVAALAWLVLRSRKERSTVTAPPSSFSSLVRQWTTPLILNGSEAVAPIGFLLSWISVESAGNENAMGSSRADGWDADGQPHEVSIWQLDPGNRQTAGGMSAASLRSMPAVVGNKAASEALRTAPLTEDFIKRQVTAGLTYIKACRAIVDAALNATGTPWRFPSVDYLRAVKSCHGSTFVMKVGLPAVVRAGRTPGTFQALADDLTAHPGLSGLSPGQLKNVLDNALETAT